MTTTSDSMRPDIVDRAAREAEPGVLAAVLAQLTGDLRWVHDPRLDELRNYRAQPEAGHAGSYLAEAAEALREVTDAESIETTDPDDATLLTIARSALSSDLTEADIPRLRHHLRPQASWPDIDPADAARRGLTVTIVGAGMSGLGLAFNLAAAGIEYTILERRDGVGGVWFDNRYPDCGVDVQAFQYAYELAPHPGWSRYDAKRDEILDYIERTAEKAGVLANVRFGVEVTSATWNQRRARWSLTVTRNGREELLETDVFVAAVGALNRPKIPDIPGLEGFAGASFHTAEWDTGVDLSGKRVALIGNGSSGTQVGPAIAEVAESLIAFQRSPHWILPRGGLGAVGPVGDGKTWLVEHLPCYLGWYRFYLNFVLGDSQHPRLLRTLTTDGFEPSEGNQQLRADLTDYIRAQLTGREDLIEKLTPRYAPGGKRLVVDSGWYATLTRPNVHLVTGRIERITDSGIVTDDGTHHAVDVIVFATGFHGTRFFWPMEIVGRSGRSLADAHGGADDIRAYLGVVMPGYPNFFSLQGPNSSIGHPGGVTFLSECQSRFILACLNTMIQEDLRTMEVRQDTSDQYNDEMDVALRHMVWSEVGLDSRYHNTTGRIVMNHPWTIAEFWERTKKMRLNDFVVQPRCNSDQKCGPDK